MTVGDLGVVDLNIVVVFAAAFAAIAVALATVFAAFAAFAAFALAAVAVELGVLGRSGIGVVVGIWAFATSGVASSLLVVVLSGFRLSEVYWFACFQDDERIRIVLGHGKVTDFN